MRSRPQGGSKIFSRRADFHKIFENYVDLFFQVETKSELFQITKKTLFWSSFLRRRLNVEVFKHFLDNFEQILAFFLARAPPSKLVYIGTKGAFRKFLGSVTKSEYLIIAQREDPLGQEVVESLRKNRTPSPSLYPLLLVLTHYHCHGRGSFKQSDDHEMKAFPLC